MLVAIGLAMDSAAVSMAGGASARLKNAAGLARIALIAGVMFGTAQAGMLAIGWLGRTGLKNFIKDIDHWVAFFLLGVVGCRMIIEAMSGRGEKRADLLDMRLLVALSIATSIDALIVGIGLGFANGTILLSAMIVGVVTFALSSFSAFVGGTTHTHLGKSFEVIGGMILIGIGTNTLITHLAGG